MLYFRSKQKAISTFGEIPLLGGVRGGFLKNKKLQLKNNRKDHFLADGLAVILRRDPFRAFFN
jgi:hypothetical protein